MNEPLSDFNKIISNFKSDGFAKINSFLSDSKELANLKHKLYSLVCIKAKQYNIEIPTESESSINNSILELNSINNKLFINDGHKKISVKAIKVQHGKVDSICYIIDQKLAYISDVSDIYKKDFRFFQNLEYLIIDCLWLRYHPSHLNLTRSLDFIKFFKPKKAILTNLHSDLDYDYLKKILPKKVKPAYDGLTFEL